MIHLDEYPNGLVTWNAEDIWLRNIMIEYFANTMQSALKSQNKAWEFIQIEAPILTQSQWLNKEYTEDNIFFAKDSDLRLRPETTAGSYLYAKHLLNTHSNVKPPVCVWQAGKSFRQEQDQAAKNMRLKEFYQQEFQCIYSNATKNDYYENMMAIVHQMISKMVGKDCRLVESDRLPSYSLKTMDIEVILKDRFMELCSISKRNDFAENFTVLEVAIGLDRCVYIRNENDPSI